VITKFYELTNTSISEWSPSPTPKGHGTAHNAHAIQAKQTSTRTTRQKIPLRAVSASCFQTCTGNAISLRCTEPTLRANSSARSFEIPSTYLLPSYYHIILLFFLLFFPTFLCVCAPLLSMSGDDENLMRRRSFINARFSIGLSWPKLHRLRRRQRLHLYKQPPTHTHIDEMEIRRIGHANFDFQSS